MSTVVERALPRALTGEETRLLCTHRRWLHAHPELAFRERKTADYVAAELAALGLVPERGLATTGIVATIEGQRPGPAVGLRADMDALPVQERTGADHASTHAGTMHACGHDGHTAMLLGAARLLAQERDFAGRVHLVFQPAEENEGGGRVMVEEGLFERYPMEAIYGLHNWPGLPQGHVAVRPGPMMASFDVFEITLRGRGGHAAMPHRVDDVVLAGSALAMSLQTVVSRRLDPAQRGVLSITQVLAGNVWNVLPDVCTLKGTCRAFGAATRDRLESAMREVAAGIAQAHGVDIEVRYERRVPATVNDAGAARLAARCAVDLLGAARVRTEFLPSMAGEDFSFMLERCPGAYLWLGVGEAHAPLHSPHFDFNDAVLADGSRLLAAIAMHALQPKKGP
ncbi:M20 aminoacylase family protein [Variovorax paradoxus]|uniref:M20 aminoacylase family protein n=1 Tax=Variovorax paradoxus TaxID=34073 RepID=UPI00247A10C6